MKCGDCGPSAPTIMGDCMLNRKLDNITKVILFNTDNENKSSSYAGSDIEGRLQ